MWSRELLRYLPWKAVGTQTFSSGASVTHSVMNEAFQIQESFAISTFFFLRVNYHVRAVLYNLWY